MRVGRHMIGMAWALLAAGCLSRPPVLPDSRLDPRHPFPEDQLTYKTPAIVKSPYEFPPEPFPQKAFEGSQSRPVDHIKTVATKPPVEEPVVAPPLREPLADALQCILDNRHDEALRRLQAYDPETQDWFLRLLPALSILTRKKMSELSPAEVAVLQEQLSSLLASIRPRAELSLGKVCFCEWIKSYGDYKPLPESYAFAPPTATRPGECVQLYVEVRNFTSQMRGGHFETRLASAVEIRDGQKVMWSYRFEDEKHALRCRTQLHDHYTSYSFHVPRNIPPGTYTLEVQIADETNPEARRVARRAIEFHVAAPSPTRAAR